MAAAPPGTGAGPPVADRLTARAAASAPSGVRGADDRRGELAAFLRSRRAQVRPEAHGLAGGPRRQVPGLRRDEVAFLAGISTDYYIRLEQGREARPSDAVLTGLGGALLLDPLEQRHLHVLARADESVPEPRLDTARATSTRQMLDSLPFPAVLVDHRLDLAARNAAATDLLAPLLFPYDDPTAGDADFEGPEGPEGSRSPGSPESPGGPGGPEGPRSPGGPESPGGFKDYGDNYARAVFLSPSAHAFFEDWAQAAHCTAATLRTQTGGNRTSRRLAQLLTELHEHSETFTRHWEDHALHRKTTGDKRFHHPRLGTLDLTQHTMDLPHGGGHSVWLFQPRNAATAEALRSLPPSPADN
ncbi:hypothetical protein A6A06_34430 [Streptomyces sp. CB02923]|uniref:helix-turn-helix transcriptional regulator n=1 Tax=Streptomyces sp. CB02923 TaxID=1718985 RepID=UPI00093E7F93|nr:helix-turn-helix transcriptional regulator [Streptomyces sp. CB02923]OKI07972.1 hypothetical protein A6A06_34430 [Streptomyces sp. CB02923]